MTDGSSEPIVSGVNAGNAEDQVLVNDLGRVGFASLAGFDEIMLAMETGVGRISVPIDWGGNWKSWWTRPPRDGEA